MNFTYKIGLCALIVFIAAFFSGCTKSSSSGGSGSNNDTLNAIIADDDGGYVSDYSKMEQTSEDVISIADVAYAAALAHVHAGPAAISGCDTIGIDTNVIPHKLTIDFGNNDCNCADGKTRKGQIIVYFTQFYTDSGSIHYIHYNHYYVNDQQFGGIDSIVNLGLDTSGNVYYSANSNDSINTASGIVRWTSSRLVHWYQGANTPARNDDAFKVTGSASVTRPNDHVFSVSSISALWVYIDCNWIQQGSISATPVLPVAGTARTANYGNSNFCDNSAIYTNGASVKTITMQ